MDLVVYIDGVRRRGGAPAGPRGLTGVGGKGLEGQVMLFVLWANIMGRTETTGTVVVGGALLIDPTYASTIPVAVPPAVPVIYPAFINDLTPTSLGDSVADSDVGTS